MSWSELGRTLPQRRSVLAGLGTGTLLALTGSPLITGCRSDDSAQAGTPSPTPTPDEALRQHAISRVRDLQDTVRQVTAPSPVRAVLARLAESYPTQLAALGEPDSSASAPTRTAATAPTTTGSAEPVTPAAFVAAQTAAAAETLTGCTSAGSPGMAVLLARLAAAHAAGADLVAAAARLPAPGKVAAATGTDAPAATGPPVAGDAPAIGSPGTARTSGPPSDNVVRTTGPATPSLGSEQVTALTRLLNGEHAAVYAYGVITARVAEKQRARARACWNAHLAGRNEVVRLLTSAGANAPAALPAYDIADLPGNSAAATGLAATVEGRLTTLAASTVGTTTDGARTVAAGLLVAAARRRAGWVPDVEALPGE